MLRLLAEDAAKRVVQEVCGRVAAARGLAPLVIDGRRDTLADGELALANLDLVNGETGDRLFRVGDLGARSARRENAPIADLAARLAVERRDVEHDFGALARYRARHQGAVLDDRDDFPLALLALVAEKAYRAARHLRERLAIHLVDSRR